MIKLISRFISFEILFTLLHWKITKFHNLRENKSCKVCAEFYHLYEFCKYYEKHFK
jgi:hypothetical protein